MRSLNRLPLVCLVTCAAMAQDAAPAKTTIPVLIQNSHHEPAIHLTPESLVINQHKTAVSDFSLSSMSDLPLRLGILLDVSGSERSRGLQRVTVSASDFARGLLHAQNDLVFFGVFGMKPMTTQWVDRAGVAKVVIPANVGGGTALYDAIVAACKQMGEVDWTKPARRVLVVISDGEDNQSHVTLQRAVAEAVRSGVVIFTVSTDESGLELRGAKILESLARLTGGETISLSERTAPKAFARISDLMNGLYLLSYVPAPVPKEQDLEIKPASKEKMYFSWPKMAARQ